LWVVSEDNTARYVSGYGDPVAKTPNIEGLAAKGIRFTRANSAAPVCSPARSTIISGMYASSLGTQNHRSQYRLPDNVRGFPEYLRRAGYFTTNRGKRDYSTASDLNAAWDEDGPEAHWRHRKANRPFFSVFNFGQSHESCLHKPRTPVTDPKTVVIPPYLPDTPVIREDIARYYDCVARADEAIGKVLKELEEDGLEQSTIVFYYSDNGGILPRSKRFLYANGTHVPMIAYFPKAYAHLAPVSSGGKNGELINFVDLAPTILSIAGVEPPEYFQGRAFAGVASKEPPRLTFSFAGRADERIDASRSVTDGRFTYIRNYYPHLPQGRINAYGWLTPSVRECYRLFAEGKLDETQQRYFLPKPAEQLFDSDADPDNIRDLANDPAYADDVKRFRAALVSHIIETRDSVFAPEVFVEEMARETNPRDALADTVAYPIEDLARIVDRLQLEHPAPDETAKLLADEHALVRYWAVLSTIGQMADADAVAVKRRALLDDSSPEVRLMAAEAIIRSDVTGAETKKAWDIVQASLDATTRPLVALAAGNVVADRKDAPEAAIATLRSLAKFNGPGFGPPSAQLFGSLGVDRDATFGKSQGQ
jgi:arylsulfatase A-like enzyme